MPTAIKPAQLDADVRASRTTLRRRALGTVVVVGLVDLPCVAIFIWALVTRGENKHPQAQCEERILGPSQGFQGNDDAYGLGIRLGIYLQWFAQFLANWFLADSDAQDMFSAVVAFDIALVVATMILTFGSECVFDVEIYIVLFIFWGSLYALSSRVKIADEYSRTMFEDDKDKPQASRLSRAGASAPEASSVEQLQSSGERPKQGSDSTKYENLLIDVLEPFTNLSTVMTFPLLQVMSVYSTWFFATQIWAVGANFASAPGSDRFFLLANVSVSNSSANAFLLAGSLLLILVAVFVFPLAFILTVISLYCLVKGDVSQKRVNTFRKLTRWSRQLQHQQIFEREMKFFKIPYRSFSNRGLSNAIRTALMLFVACCVAYTILAIELTLRWNHVTDVYQVRSTGQNIPLVIGITGMLTTVWKIRQKHKYQHLEHQSKEESDDVTEHINLHCNSCGSSIIKRSDGLTASHDSGTCTRDKAEKGH